MSNEGQRHHYIPVCYLKQWMNEKEKVCQYSKPYAGRVIAISKHPSAMGYVRGLYEFPGIEDQEIRETLEREFMKPVDTRAAELLREMTAGINTMNNMEKRSAWTTFLLSLMLRMPEDVKFHKERYLADWYKSDSARRKFYKRIWKPGLPNRVEDVIARMDPQEIEWRAIEALVPLMTNPRIGEFINRMKWGSLLLPFQAPALLTSDRPLIISNGLAAPDSHLILPINPKRIFYAVNNQRVVNYLMTQNVAELTSMINRIVVQQAINYVYAKWDVHLDFVQRHMGTAQLPSLVERMADSRSAQKNVRRLKRLRRKGVFP